MASSIRIAILANAAQAKKELNDVAGTASKIGDKFSKFRAPAAAALGAIGLGAGKAISSASDLNETISKSNQIFGANAGSIEKWAGGAAKNLGLSKQSALESAAGFGDMFSQIGFAGDQAAKMSTDVVGLSADLGSFNNLPTADVSERIAGAFRGEYDSLQKLIPNISAARVEQEAMAATGKKSAKDLTAQEKATAVLAIVQKDGARASGDFARTQDGAANSTKIAAATAQDLAAGLGQQLLPAYTAVLQFATGFLTKMQEHQGVVTAVVAVVGILAAGLLAASAASTIYTGVLAVQKIALGISAAAQWALNAAMLANPVGLIILAIVALVAIFVVAYKNSETFRNIVNGALNAVLAVAKVVWNGIKAAAQAVWSFISGYVRLQIAIVTAVIKALVAVAKAVWEAIKSAAVSVWNGIKSSFSSAVESIKSGFGKVRSFASDVLSKIKSLFSPGALIDAGRKLMEGLARGISGAIGKAVDAVRRGVQKIKNLLPGSPIKDGPLKSWNNGGAGKRLMGFLAYGIDQGSGQVRTSMARALDPATSLRGMTVAGASGATGGGTTNVYVTANPGVDYVALAKEIAKAQAAGKAAGVRVAA